VTLNQHYNVYQHNSAKRRPRVLLQIAVNNTRRKIEEKRERESDFQISGYRLVGAFRRVIPKFTDALPRLFPFIHTSRPLALLSFAIFDWIEYNESP